MGCRAPSFQKPTVCRIVARPDISRPAEIRKVMSAGGRPKAFPTIRGTATTPAYMLITCCRP